MIESWVQGHSRNYPLIFSIILHRTLGQYMPFSYCTGPDSIPGQPMLGSVAGKLPLGQIFLQVLQFPITIIPPTLHTHTRPSTFDAI